MNNTKTLNEWQQLAREQGISTKKQGKTKLINKTIAELRSEIEKMDSPVQKSFEVGNPIEYMIYKGYKLDAIPNVVVPEKYPSRKKMARMTHKERILAEDEVYPKITKHQRRVLISCRLYHAGVYSNYRWIEGLGTDDNNGKEMTLKILPVHISGMCKRYDITLTYNGKEYTYSTRHKDDAKALQRYIHTNFYVRDPVKYTEPYSGKPYCKTHYYYASPIYVKDDTLTQTLF